MKFIISTNFSCFQAFWCYFHRIPVFLGSIFFKNAIQLCTFFSFLPYNVDFLPITFSGFSMLFPCFRLNLYLSSIFLRAILGNCIIYRSRARSIFLASLALLASLAIVGHLWCPVDSDTPVRCFCCYHFWLMQTCSRCRGDRRVLVRCADATAHRTCVRIADKKRVSNARCCNRPSRG